MRKLIILALLMGLAACWGVAQDVEPMTVEEDAYASIDPQDIQELAYFIEYHYPSEEEFAFIGVCKIKTIAGADNINQNGESVFPYTFGKLEIMEVDKGDLKAGDIVNYTYYGAIIEKDKVMAADYGDGFLEDLEDLQSDKTYLYMHNAGVIDLEVGQTYLLYMNEPSTKSPRIDAYDISFMRYPHE